ncbi:penicillin acylase family protein [Amycolatopsis rhizosphaerae]|uniref:Penicillin acylase family protein n=1 Tax=Amycolatopsis rhizosphaerae TaxID=2053003 RepID=A0A558DKZ8_9PSEU|nr:penicillin acylase family protein [Amycolatopsis rhizosphaerae]TVT61652.1 penicillin acylase family protein [Amycolatopsis rhizosphaerae]
MNRVSAVFKRPSSIFASAALVLVTSAAPAAATATPPTYRAHDYADGRVLSIDPPGENGLVNLTQLAQFELTGQRPPNSNDQLGPYAGLLYGAPSLTDASLGAYYGDESFGIAPGSITRTEHPTPGQPVVIYRDTRDIPHIYGDNDGALAFGAGYAQAEDRLFLMDVLRHYGEGRLSEFLGPSCADEQMDHDQLLLAPYTPAQAQAQVDALPAEFGAQGALARQMMYSYVDGVNAYLARTATDPGALPADYAAALQPPRPWSVADVVYVTSLIGGIFGDGGGSEVHNAALLQYLQGQLGPAPGRQAFTDLRQRNDADAPTTVDTAFPYEIPGPLAPALTAMPDDAGKPLTGGPAGTTPGCDLVAAGQAATTVVANLLAMPQHMSNALLVSAQHSGEGHPIAVFGPQVSYFAPGILMQEDLHSPDYDAEGASFPGTGLVELGRGQDFAWSATSAGSDLTDQRLERVCDPTGAAPAPTGKYYEFNGQCLPMTHETFTETAVPKPGGVGAPAVITHDIYLTGHGIVQGWTTADGGAPVAVVDQRSTYGHEVDSVVGFLRWGEPALTHDAQSWMTGAAQIGYTFNWFYADSRDIAYYNSGLDPVRHAGADPDLPTWGTGGAEWQGFLPAAQHPHAIDPPSGVLTSWNNKPAPQFSAADSQYGYGPAYRVQMLDAQIQAQLDAHAGRLTRTNLVQAMETAASQDLDGLTTLPELLPYLAGRAEPAGVRQMLDVLAGWNATGDHRRKAAPGDTQYADHAAVAIMDVLQTKLIRALFDPLLAAGGVTGVGSTGGASATGYSVLPMQWVNTPNSGGAHLGSAYDGGYESYLVKVLRQLRNAPVGTPFGSGVLSRICGSGPADCPAAIDRALADTYRTLVSANGGSTDAASWTSTPDTVAAKQTMPQYDAIAFRGIGIVGQPDIDWQNRPTFQQVAEFGRHR